MNKEETQETGICESLDGQSTAQREARRNRSKILVSRLLLALLTLWSAWRIYHFTHGTTKLPSLHTDKIQWTSCGDGYECGHLLVPLDYQGGTPGYANLAVARLLAKNTTARLGSLFVNPGGPGGSGVLFILREGSAVSQILDDRYDIVSWDPRGVNRTSPRVDCYSSQAAQDIAFSHTYLDFGFEARNLSDPADLAVYLQQVHKADAENAVIVERCLNYTGEALRHVGTAAVVRDLELLARVIEGPDKPINFWGFSYGTVVGSYFVNMFPHRVGNVVIDGVVDPVNWSTSGAYERGKWDYADTEKAYANFLKACEDAGPARCALNANQTSTASVIYKAVDQFINQLYERPLPVPFAEQPYILTSGMVRMLIFTSMYQPRTWATLSELLATAMRGDGAPILNSIIKTIELDTTKKAKTSMSTMAILCGDGPELGGLGGLDLQKAFNIIAEENKFTYERVSSHANGLDVSMCHHWKSRETERFVGPFNRTDLANNILVIGNTADPITPLANARAVNKMLPQSRLIIQDGSGHCSTAMASTCTAKIIREYFFDGVIPPNGIVCETVEKPFPETSTFYNATAWLKPGVNMSQADIRLAESLKVLGQALTPFVGQHGKPKHLI